MQVREKTKFKFIPAIELKCQKLIRSKFLIQSYDYEYDVYIN